MKNLYLITLITLLSFDSIAQNILGTILDNEKKPVPYATVMLKKSSDSTLYKGEITGDAGDFVFSAVKAGNYFLQIQYIGFETLILKDITVSEETPELNLGDITLQNTSKELGAVTVEAEKPFIEKLADRTVINIENSIIQTGSSIMEVMEKLPGVIVDQNGNIALRGKQGVIIMIDGKPSTLAGQDLANMLRGMPSGNIQKIELITNPSAKWDASGNAGIINIIMKKNRMEGYNGSVSLTYGQGRYPKYSGAVNFNYKKDWFNLFFNYSYSRRLSFNHLMINRKFYENDTIRTTFINDNYLIYPFNTHAPRLGMDFRLSDKTSLSVLGAVVTSTFKPTADNTSHVYDQDHELIGSYIFTNRSDDEYNNAEINTQITHRLDTLGQEITLNLDYGRYLGNSDQFFTTIFTDEINSTENTTYLTSHQIGALSLYSAKADYTKPFPKKITFESGLKSSLVESDKDMQFFSKVNEDNIFDSARSSHFLYSENINAAYVNFNKKFEKWTVQAGLRAEHTYAKGKQLLNDKGFDRNYVQLFPTIYLDYKFNKDHNVNANIGRRINRPHYEQMNPFRRLIDANTYGEGNPYLLPQITYVTELSYAYKNALHLAVGYHQSRDNIMSVLIQDAATQTTIQTVVNIDRYDYYSFNLSYANRLTKWWKTNTSVLTYLGNYAGTVRDFTIDQGTPSFYVSTNNSFTIIDGFSMEANLHYNHRALYGVTLMKSTYNFSLGLQKSVLKKQGTLTLNMSDIFWKAWPSGVTEFGTVIEHWASERETRVLNVSFSYKFGKGQTGRMRRSTGADEEKRRM